MKNESTITEVINQNDAAASNEKVCRKGNSCKDTPSPMGRLQKRYDEWEKVTSSPFILSVIREGYKLPIRVIPQPVELKNNKSARDNTQFVYEKVIVKRLYTRGRKQAHCGKFIDRGNKQIR